MDKDQLDGLLALKLVAEKRNFSAAAEELGISPPAMSKIVKQLEAKLGASLLTRTTRSTSLTEAGERFLAQVGPALEQIAHAIEDVNRFSEKPSGVLRLNLPRMIYPSFLAPIIASFTKKYPEIAVELFLEDAPSDVVAKGFDAGIRISDILAQDMIALKLLGPLYWVAVGSPKYLNKAGRPKHPKDLLNHDCIRVRISDWLYDKWEFEQKGKPLQVQVKGSLIFNDSLLAMDAAISGLGLMYVDEASVRDKIEAGKLEVVLRTFASSSSGYYLYYPHRSVGQSKLRAFIDHVKSAL